MAEVTIQEAEKVLAAENEYIDHLKHKLNNAYARQVLFKEQLERAKMAAAPPVDRSNVTLTDGSPVTSDHREIKENGQQKDYVVLSAEERAKGFVRPLRESYIHKTCGDTTRMSREIAETYSRDPGFYSGTYCCHCRAHFPLDQFVWTGTNEQVGS